MIKNALQTQIPAFSLLVMLCAVVRVERKDKREVGSLFACTCNSLLQSFSSDIKAGLKHWHTFSQKFPLMFSYGFRIAKQFWILWIIPNTNLLLLTAQLRHTDTHQAWPSKKWRKTGAGISICSTHVHFLPCRKVKLTPPHMEIDGEYTFKK